MQTTQARTMRYESDGSISLLEVAIDDPKPGEVQLAGGACGICSWDIATAKLGSNMNPMAPPGHEGVGHVVKVGAGVTAIKEGDRVAGGGFASLRNLPASSVYKIPESPLADEFWVVEPVSCVVTGLDQSQIRPGDTVALIGTGFMGLLFLQALLREPLGGLVAVDVLQSRLDLARRLGAPEVHNSATSDRAELVRELKRREFDVVIDTTGAQAGLDLATDITRRGGRINLFGWIKGDTATFDPTKWHGGGFTIVNASPSARIRDPFPPAIRMMHQGIFDLRPLVTHTTPLDGYAALMDGILHKEIGYVKGVVTL